MGYYLTAGGTVLELDLPTEGTHARGRFDEQVAKGELIAVPAEQVETVKKQFGVDKDGNPLYATQFVLADGYHAPSAPTVATDATTEPAEPTEPATLEEAEVPDGTVDEVINFVRGTDDPDAEPAEGWEDRAHAALTAESDKGDKARSTLVDKLNALLAGD